ncbi:uncharacterized protein LOC129941260 [Eupeodes corollae]|uniref:uncharacterized protein LOC129941260 n=1 Tax=Eupeodes corollae TaxID=290404 RepID=UPI002491A956|nr:uncharacterized protein LOC129941260 [Eupeodes corollae]
MEMTPKLPRKSLSLTSRLRNRSSASPSPRHRLRTSIDPSSPIAIQNDDSIEGTPPHRKFTFNFPYSPTNDTDFSPRSILSQSSNNSPDVTWQWTQEDRPAATSSNTSKSTPNSANVKELRKKRSVERKEEIRRAELEKRKTNKNKRDDLLKKQCEQVELIISKKCASTLKSVEKDFVENKQFPSEPSGFHDMKEKKEDLFDDSSFDGILEIEHTDLAKPSVVLEKKVITPRKKQTNSNAKVKKPASPIILPPPTNSDLDLLLDDSESEGLLLEASQQVEITFETKAKKSCTKELERSFEETPIDKDKSSTYDFLQDSFDDCFALVDEDAFAAEPKKPRMSLQRYKSMPTESPTSNKAKNVLKPSPDTTKIRRYPSSTTLRPKSKFR